MSLLTNYWFDFVVVLVLGFGFALGARNKAMPQLLSALHWTLTFGICLFLYKAPAIWLAKTLSAQPDVVALILFPVEFLVVYILLYFALRRFKKRMLDKEEPFGEGETRMAKVAGAIRFFVLMFIVTAWISGRYVTEQDVLDHKAFCKENFGSITVPVLCTIHDDIFNRSFAGKFADKHLGALMMTAIPRVDYGEKQTAPRKWNVKLKEFDAEGGFELGADGTNNVKEPAEDAEASAASGPAPNQIVYRDLTLRGVSGTGDRLFALINDQTFQTGELSSVKYEDRKINLRVLRILSQSVLVRLEDQAETIELKLGVATDLKGEPVVKTN